MAELLAPRAPCVGGGAHATPRTCMPKTYVLLMCSSPTNLRCSNTDLPLETFFLWGNYTHTPREKVMELLSGLISCQVYTNGFLRVKQLFPTVIFRNKVVGHAIEKR